MAAPLRSFATTALRQAHAGKLVNKSLSAPVAAKAIARPFTASSSPDRQGPSATPPASQQAQILLEDPKAGFGFVRHNPLPPKPRRRGVTEIRGPYYSAVGPRYLADVLEIAGPHIDGLKFAGGSFALLPEAPLRQLLDLAHAHGAYVSTGGWIEHILSSGGTDAVDHYLTRCKALGFDVVELSAGFISLPPDDWVRLAERVRAAGLEPKPELGIQFGAGGDTSAAELRAIGTSDPGRVVDLARRFVRDAGVERVMIESEGITENVGDSWRTDVINDILRELPLENVMFEAADPAVFNWYIREFGVDVNLFVDHSQIVQLAGLRAGIWGKSDTFGKITTFRPPDTLS
ncbi:putative sulfonate biosynthesis enzyme [Durotheca rogersii]|uniref:putative sulfonate biosynthesis enzyme n=1 Tax=Durotheca rogersii TaxID=419775 RepID=UPI0022205538|nr:putative sulfonate biosynthesis enzyme [Durotheca rogersii]KAI5864917.1 putative sulfonate biosynthesis enzyme [Durotheca rogersii]